MTRRIATAAVTAAALLATPAGALAADAVAVNGGVLTYVSGTGTKDVIGVYAGSAAGRYLLTDWSSPSGTPGAGCAWSALATVECVGVSSASLSTLDGDDYVRLDPALPATIDGGAGDDTIFGGPAADSIDAGDGDDTVDTRDGAADSVDCGAGMDTAQADPADVLVNCNDPLAEPVTPAVDPTPPPVEGDAVTTPPVVQPPVVTLPPLGLFPVVLEVAAEIRVGAAGIASFTLSCSPSEVAGCRGTVYLDPEPRTRSGAPRAVAARRGRFGRSGFNVAAGRRARVSVKLSASGRRALGLPTGRRARMARRGRPVKAVVTVAPKGKKPSKSKVKLKP